jgi:hypothetical protein
MIKFMILAASLMSTRKFAILSLTLRNQDRRRGSCSLLRTADMDILREEYMCRTSKRQVPDLDDVNWTS